MRGRLGFIAGAAAGYVLGAKAGRTRYEQIKSQADQLWHDPRVQEAVSTAQTQVTEVAKSGVSSAASGVSTAASAAKAKVADLASNVGGSGSDDLPAELGEPASVSAYAEESASTSEAETTTEALTGTPDELWPAPKADPVEAPDVPGTEGEARHRA